jgi:hypothetical protein
MYAKTITLLIWLMLLSNLQAQNKIVGTIYDENEQPLYGVSIYFDGTTIGTTTDKEGNFLLNIQEIPKTTLVISFIGYETIYLNDVSKQMVYKLKPTSLVLKEVVLEPIPFSRKDLLRVFRDQFLGETRAGKHCVILNEDAIQFVYENKTFKLSAIADEKLIIQNNHLGYLIEFELIDFYVNYNKRTLSYDYLRGSYFAGTSFFKPFSENNKSFIKNRIDSYLGSSKHFFRNLVDNKWSATEFLLYEGKFPTNPDFYFEIEKTDNPSYLKVKINSKNNLINGKFYQSFNLLYKNKKQSRINFHTAELYVDYYGNTTHIDQYNFSGAIADKRLGDMLPMDFVYDKK